MCFVRNLFIIAWSHSLRQDSNDNEGTAGTVLLQPSLLYPLYLFINLFTRGYLSADTESVLLMRG